MTVKQLQDYIFTSKYSHYLPDKLRRETFDEAADRVIDMHRRFFAERGLQIEDLLSVCEKGIKSRRVLGSQRALQFGGDPILRKNTRIYNCATSYCDRASFFSQALWVLLCGAGVGFSVQRHHIARLPDIARPSGPKVTHLVHDSIEGWADALASLLSSYFQDEHPFPRYAGKEVVFDFSQVRPKGSAISGSTGKAPGPKPLERALGIIRRLLDRCSDSGRRLRPIDAYDVVMHASDAVLSGGVRRSASICLFSPDDEDMLNAKTGNWLEENPQRARSNNSAMLIRGETDRSTFDRVMASVREFGEPGFVWADDRDVTYNPCVEIGLYPQIDGVSGWAFCNLCEINMGSVDSRESFREAAYAAAVLGTLQAAYTDFGYLGDTTRRITEREALLGVSMTGMMDTPEVAFDPEIQREMARHILEVNEQVASRIGINPCARATCVKPAGTTSCILGTSSGIHPHHARRYFRRAQANDGEQVAQFFRQHNPLAVERSVWDPNGTDLLVIFCIEAQETAKLKRDFRAVDLLEHVKLTKANWVDAGRREGASVLPGMSHNVSNTITVKDDEWDEVADFIFANKDHFAGVSLLPEGGDLDYPQAPFVEVLTAAEIVETYGVGAIMSSGLVVDGMKAFDDNLWVACDAALGRGEISDPGAEQAHDWVRRARKFADNYFDGNILKMTRCLKRVHSCKQWEDLQREYRHVDYTQLIEGGDNTKVEQTIACGGGSCDIL